MLKLSSGLGGNYGGARKYLWASPQPLQSCLILCKLTLVCPGYTVHSYPALFIPENHTRLNVYIERIGIFILEKGLGPTYKKINVIYIVLHFILILMTLCVHLCLHKIFTSISFLYMKFFLNQSAWLWKGLECCFLLYLNFLSKRINFFTVQACPSVEFCFWINSVNAIATQSKSSIRYCCINL